MRISVIMPVYLGSYEHEGIKSATNPEGKFVRAVNSFINQTFQDCELIIISDGCDKSKEIVKRFTDPRIRFKQIEKQVLFSGKVRQSGIEISEGEIICYLDHDDVYGENHLEIINANFDTEKYDYVYFNDYVLQSLSEAIEREVSPAVFHIGTSSIAHTRACNVVWGDGYCHDWRMINTYLIGKRSIKIPTPEYYVCHFHPNDF